MAFREVRVFEIREVLMLWLRGEGVRATQRLAGVDRKTVRRHLAAAVELGLSRDGGEQQLNDEFMGSVVEKVRPHRMCEDFLYDYQGRGRGCPFARGRMSCQRGGEERGPAGPGAACCVAGRGRATGFALGSPAANRLDRPVAELYGLDASTSSTLASLGALGGARRSLARRRVRCPHWRHRFPCGERR